MCSSVALAGHTTPSKNRFNSIGTAEARAMKQDEHGRLYSEYDDTCRPSNRRIVRIVSNAVVSRPVSASKASWQTNQLK